MEKDLEYPLSELGTPAYVQEEVLLRRNLEVIRGVAESAGVEIILAFKAYALWKCFPIMREYISCSTASSPWEARLGLEEMGSRTHTYAPAYKVEEFGEILRCSSHITFNSLAQFERFYPLVQSYEDFPISCGIRINPEFSVVETDLYNPATPGSRLGTPLSGMPEVLPRGVEGLHFHTLCESSSYDLERTLEVVERRFGHFFDQIKWLNMGGGHLMTRDDYDVEHLVEVLKRFKERYPHLHIILEPGSAFAWETGYLAAQVLDVVENGEVRTVILDVSFTCHMPDTLEMPYQPRIRGVEREATERCQLRYRVGGHSCLSGDFIPEWYYFAEAPKVGDLLILEDMMHYTTVKTTMFNGITHPSIYLHKADGSWELLRKFEYRDYKERMD